MSGAHTLQLTLLLLTTSAAAAAHASAPLATTLTQSTASSAAAGLPTTEELLERIPEALRAHDPGAEDGDLHARLLTMAQTLDEAEGLSTSREWLAIMGWSVPLETVMTLGTRALDQAPGRYPVDGARDDPALDLRASIALAWTQPGFSCRFPLRARFLARHHLIPTPLSIDRGGCPEYEAFAHPERIEAIDLLYTSQSWGEPGTSAGHVLFKVHETSPNHAYNEDDSRTFSYAVNMDIPENQENLVWRGLVGEAQGELMVGRASRVEELYGTAEQRDIHVYRLELSRQQMRDLLALFWVQQREGSSASYYFFSVNCARLTYDALRTVLPELPRKSAWFLHPHEVVVALSDHLTPLGVRPSRRRKAVEAEHHREVLAESLSGVAGFDALHEERWSDAETRTRAMERFAAKLSLQSLTPLQRQALTDYLDAVIDIEVYDIDVQQGVHDDNVTSPLLDATIDLRAKLPARPAQSLEAPASVGLEGSGSRRMTIRTGVNDRGQPVAGLRMGVIDEQPAEPYATSLNRYGRNAFLVTDLAVRMEGLELHIDEIRTVLLSVANYSEYVRTTAGWWASHSGFVFDVSMQSLPSRDIPWGTWIRFGQSLSLVQSHEHLGLLVIGADLSLASWLHDGDYFRGGLGVWLEGSLPFDGAGAHRLWVSARVQPTLVELDGYATELELTSRLDFTLSKSLGCVLGLYFNLNHDQVLNDQYQGGVLLAL